MFRFYINCHNWTPTEDQWNYGARCITRSELERIDRFVFKSDAKFAFAGQLLIRSTLAKAFRRLSSEFFIKRTERQRPYVDSDRKFDFNLSHHHRLVCLAATFDGRVGCDTMEYRIHRPQRDSIESTTNLLKREFSTDEYRFILNETNDENTRIQRFYRIWSLKESYVKWSGVGIDCELSKLDFHVQTKDFNPQSPTMILSDTKLIRDGRDQDSHLRFDEQIIYLPDGEQQIITVCLSKTNPCEEFRELTMDEILQDCNPLDEHATSDERWWMNFQSKSVK